MGILTVLLQKGKVTAPYLAERFEVSRRTINRDVEALCLAGIPIVTEQGKNGGISIMEGFRMDRTFLTSGEMQAVLAGLCSLDNHIQIDLSSWYRSTLAPKMEQIQDAIDQHRRITFTYCSPRGEGQRVLEPALLIFQWAAWYVWGYCCERKAFRLFKLNRLWDLQVTEEVFEPRPIPPPDLSTGRIFPTEISVRAVFAPEAKWRLLEEFGRDSFVEQEDGRLFFSFEFSDRDNLFGWILSFGDQAELLEPEDLREELHQVLTRACGHYREKTQET